MKSYLRNALAASSFALVAALLASPFVLAQTAPSTTTVPQQPVPRMFPEQLTHSIRVTLTPAICPAIAAGGSNCIVKIMNAALPANAAVLRVTAVIPTAFNSTTTDTINLGSTAAAPDNIVNAACNIHAVGVVACTVVTTAPAVTMGAAQTGKNGGFDLYAKWTYTGGSSATAGTVALVIEYAAPNDGLCVPVPLGTTPTAC